MIRNLPENLLGRDFIVGDLHGCRPMLERLLAHVAFDPSRDRLFAVGDLADRGPDSVGCLELINEPWFHSVKGNHEAMLLDCLWDVIRQNRPPIRKAHYLFDNGGQWIFDVYDQNEGVWLNDFPLLFHKLKNLPFVLIVGEGAHRFNIVHADLSDPACPDEVMRDSDLDQLGEEWSDFDWETHPEDWPYFTSRFLWSRVLMSQPSQDNGPRFVPGLSPTFCGHTIDCKVRIVKSHVCIDRGAFLTNRDVGNLADYGLVLVDITSQETHFVSAADPMGTVQISELCLR